MSGWLNKLFSWAESHSPLAATILTIAVTGICLPALKRIFTSSQSGLFDFFWRRKRLNWYLDWLIGDHRYLPLLPTTLVPIADGTHHKELDDLYVSLTLETQDNSAKQITLKDAFKKGHRLLILGDPGAGKTTMLRFLTLNLARQLRARPGKGDKQERWDDLRRFRKASEWIKRELDLSSAVLPVFLYLNRLHDIATWPQERGLLEVLRDDWRSVDPEHDFPSDVIQSKLDRGECFFLLDGFDELGTQDARDRVGSLIGNFVNRYGNAHFVVTSRIVGYNGQLAQHGFRVLSIQHLSTELVRRLIDNWYKAMGREGEAKKLGAELDSRPSIMDLAINPMLLSLIVLVQVAHGLIPERRHVLYEDCIKILVERRFAPAHVRKGYEDELPADEAQALLQKLALSMHRRHLREAPEALVFRDFIPSALDTMPLTRIRQVPISRIIKNIEERSQLLVRRGLSDDGSPLIAFSHLTFQEYLSALSLIKMHLVRGEPAVSTELLELYESDPEWWEEAALLYAAQLDVSQRTSFFERLYPGVSLRRHKA